MLTAIQRLRSRLQREEGFTLIELLVVMLIIGILAAIAIPTFLNQKGKANDTQAKSMAKTAQTALETFDTDFSTYNCTANGNTCDQELNKIEATVPNAYVTNTLSPCVTDAAGWTGPITKANPLAPACTPVAPGSLSYQITVQAPSTNDVFIINRATDGTTTYPCWVPLGQNTAGCPGANAGGVATAGKWG